MSLDTKDFEAITQIISNSSDDMAVAMARSFERLEERMDTTESRILTRIAELEDTVMSRFEGVTDQLGDIRTDIHGIRAEEE